MHRLSRELGGPEIWIKRDDCTGLSTGGNKTRKLEFLMAEAQAQGADMVITQGATQSNHARQTAAFAAKLGMSCHILLEDRTGSRRCELQQQRQRLARPPARRHHREAPQRPRHERRNGDGGRPAAGERAAGLHHPRRRLEPDRRARLRQLRL